MMMLPYGMKAKRFRKGLVFKAHRLFYHSTLGSREMQRVGTTADAAIKGAMIPDEIQGIKFRACGKRYIV